MDEVFIIAIFFYCCGISKPNLPLLFFYEKSRQRLMLKDKDVDEITRLDKRF